MFNFIDNNQVNNTDWLGLEVTPTFRSSSQLGQGNISCTEAKTTSELMCDQIQSKCVKSKSLELILYLNSKKSAQGKELKSKQPLFTSG